MLETVSILFKEDIIACSATKLIKNKPIYQLRHTEDERYTINIFDILVFHGNLNSYLEENGITLCYIVDEKDLELKAKCGNLIKEYGKDDKGELTKIFKGPVKGKKIAVKRF